jgi:hypothetical protein
MSPARQTSKLQVDKDNSTALYLRDDGKGRMATQTLKQLLLERQYSAKKKLWS